MSELARHYERYGWVAVPILTDAEVADLRAFLDREWARLGMLQGVAGLAQMPMSMCHWIRPVRSIMFRPAVVAAMKELMGEGCAITTELSVPRNGFTTGKRKLTRMGWHEDAGNEGHVAYLMDPRYRFAKCGLFLQDHDPEWGGTIQVVSGGHRFPLKFGGIDFRFYAKRIFNIVGERYWPTQIRVRPGTLVMFDSRLPHASTMPAMARKLNLGSGKATDVPPDKTKYVIYWNASRPDCYQQYVANMVTRANKELESPNGEYPFYADAVRMRFPRDFPPGYESDAKAAGLVIGIPPSEQTEAIRVRFEKAVGLNPGFARWATAFRDLAAA